METGRDVLNEGLHLNVEQFRLAFDLAPIGMAIVGLDLRLQRVNNSFCDALGYTEAELLSGSFVDITYPDEVERNVAMARQLLRGEIPSFRLEKCVLTKDGQEAWVNLTALLVRGNHGEPLYGLALLENITTHKQAEALLESEEQYRAFFDQTAVGAEESDPVDGRFIRVNDAFCRITLYDRDELLKLRFSDLTHPEDREEDLEKFEALVRGEVPVYESEKRYVRADGSIIWVDVIKTLARDKKGQPMHTIGIAHEITERKRTEESLRKSEERYRSFIATSSDGTYRFEAEQPVDTSLPVDEQIELFYRHGHLAECNHAMARMYGHNRPEEIIGARLGDLLPTSDPVKIVSIRTFIGNGYRLQDLETVDEDRDGNKKYFINNVNGIVESGFLLRAWGTRRDITEHKKADAQIRFSRRQLRALVGRLQTLREEERAGVAREIHDVLGQGLTSLKMDLAWLNKKLPDASDENVRAKMAERFKSAMEVLDETLANVKNLSTALRPGVLDTFGLSAAVEWQCLEFKRRTGITCESQLPEGDVPVSAERSTALFRIFQETLTNVARHSHATKVYVELTVGEGDVSLIVRDNGKGVTDGEIEAPAALGILGMRERAALLGGDVLVKGEPGKGTTVTARIPLNDSEPGADWKRE
ncbi:MAG: PAS domain S-box protein [Acidobacteria bacterium]|nr:PAS domain S-box protein [Acidobacteriota bacterium]